MAAYSIGLGLILLLIAFRGLFIILGINKRVQSFALENGWYDPIMSIEKSFSY